MDISVMLVVGVFLLSLLVLQFTENREAKLLNKIIVNRKYTPETHRHIALDYDGTIVEDGAYPYMGEPLPGAIETIEALLDEGYEIVIWTCRGGKHKAVDFIQEEEVIKQLSGLFKKEHKLGINTNFKHFTDIYEVGSPKISADVYIDNTAYGLEEVNWYKIHEDFLGKKLKLNKEGH